VQFAFPTQTVHLFRGERPAAPAHDVPGATTDRRALVSGVRAAQELTRSQPWRERPPGPVTFSGRETHLDVDDPRESTEDTRSRSGGPDPAPS